MSKILAIIVISILVTFVPTTFAAQVIRSEEVVTLEKDEVIDGDYFTTGEKVTISGTVNGDAYIGGGSILVDGVVEGDLLVGGGNINISGFVGGDIRVVGGDIKISGQVDGNVTSVGGNVKIENGGNIVGSLVVGAGILEVFGPIGKGLTAGAGVITIGNNIGSNVIAGVGEIDLTSDAKVNGDLTYFSDEKISLAKEASVSGVITQNFPPETGAYKTDEVLRSLSLGWNIYSFFITLLVGLLFVLLVPNYTKKVTSTIEEKSLVSLGIGFLTLVVTPILLILLFMSIIGIPLAILGLVLYLFIIFTSKIFTAILVGQKVLNYTGQGKSLILTLILGLLVLGVLSLIPVIGGLISFLAILVGIGSQVIVKRSIFLELRLKKII